MYPDFWYQKNDWILIFIALKKINRIKRIGRDELNSNGFVLINLVYLTKIISYVYRNEFNRIYKTISK